MEKKRRLGVPNLAVDTGIKIGFPYDRGCAVHYLYGFLLQALSATKQLSGNSFSKNTKKEQK